jgi:hypothetical protein
VSKARLDLPEPDRPGEHDQRVARKVERDVLEVVLAGATDDEKVGHAGFSDSDRGWGLGRAPC